MTALTEETTSYTFGYDGLGRLTEAYGRTYSYDAANRLTSFNGQTYNYYDAGPYHAVDRIGDFDRFDYDTNGNMTKRNKGLASQQTLVWDAENRLSQVQDNNGDMVEQYWYDVGGARVKKVSGSTTTYTFFGHYEEEVTNGVPTRAHSSRPMPSQPACSQPTFRSAWTVAVARSTTSSANVYGAASRMRTSISISMFRCANCKLA